MDIKDKKVLVVGLGRSGVASLKVLVKLGAVVSVQDTKEESKIDEELRRYLEKNKVKCYFGRDPDARDQDMLVLSPGVSPTLEFIEDARKAGVEIIGELELGYRLAKGKFVAITGTNGKTTTTSWVGEIFRCAGRTTAVVGNIGKAVIPAAMKSGEDCWYITEVSSFQLETIKEFKPVVSAILNLSPDHMDRHGTMENYTMVKSRIFENQDSEDYVVVNFDDKETLSLSTFAKATVVPFSRTETLMFGAFIKNEKIVIRNREEKIIEICPTAALKIAGGHNLENALAAAAISYFAGIEEKYIRKGLISFAGVEHRLEPCGAVNGVKYVNDSKGTNVDAAIRAIEAIDGKIVLIAGGYDKDTDFSPLIEAFGDKVKSAVLLGQTAVKIKEAAEKVGFIDTIILEGMESCVKEAARIARSGNTVLLSPACASWDMYENFEERGRHFKDCISSLEEEQE